MQVAPVVAAWWGYAQGEPVAVGIVVVALIGAAAAYLGRRTWQRRRHT